MITPRIVATTIVLVLAPVAFAVTDTWDGTGVVDDNLNTGANWLDNTAPISSLANTDLIFAGVAGLTPNVSVDFSTRSITFNNTAGAFSIGGLQLNVGTGGIRNDDTQMMTFTNLVNFGGVANSTIDAAAGGLAFANTVSLPSSTLTVSGAFATSFLNFWGSTAVVKGGVGTLTWSPNAVVQHDMTVSAGTLSTGTDGTTDVLSVTSILAVNGSSIFEINENLTLDGARLTRADDATVNLPADKTLTIQNGGDVSISGGYENYTASSIAVTGVGSTFSTTSTLELAGGGVVTVSAGGSISTGGTIVAIGTNGNGTATVTGSGSSLNGGNLILGLNGDTGTLTFSANATGTFGGINVGVSGVLNTGLTDVRATGDVNINTGGTMIVRGNMNVQSLLDIAGTVILGGIISPAPALSEFARSDSGMHGDMDFGVWANRGGWRVNEGTSVAAVPEPGIGALLAGELMLLGLRRKRTDLFLQTTH